MHQQPQEGDGGGEGKKVEEMRTETTTDKQKGKDTGAETQSKAATMGSRQKEATTENVTGSLKEPNPTVGKPPADIFSEDDDVFLVDSNTASPECAHVHQSSGNVGVIDRGQQVSGADETTTTTRVRPQAPSPDVIITMEEDGAGSSNAAGGASGAGPGRPRRVCGTGSSAASSSSDSETADDAPLLGDINAERSQQVRIEMPGGEKPASPHDRFPKERGKAIACLLLLVFAAVMNTIVLSYIHEKIPDDPPLPDIVFDHTPYFPKGLAVCEYLMLFSFISVLLLILFHRHRWIVFRRLCFIGSLLYLMRCVTMLSTQVPKADPTWHCAPKYGDNATFWNIVVRGLKIVAGVGLNVQGKNTLCGDYIYSGHTIVLVVSALFMGEYSPRRWRIIHVFYWMLALVGVAFLVVSRGHYTIDVILSYFVCTRIFWIYHTMAASHTLRMSSHNHHRKEYWFVAFHFLERGVVKPVPRRFSLPVPVNRFAALVPRYVSLTRRPSTNNRIAIE